MKVTLIRYHDKDNINTRLPESLNRIQGILPPLGIAYVASVLEGADYKVSILDAMALKLTAGEVRNLLAEDKPDIVGVTTMISNVRGALEAARIAKGCNAITVLGGPLLSVYPEEALSYDFVDYGIIGEGEIPMLELTRAVEQNLPREGIRGLIYKKNGKIVINEPFIVDDLDSLPFPARHLLPMRRYSSVIGLYPVTTMIAMRGCPYKCGFCVKGPSDKKCRIRSPKDVVDEMEELVEKYRVKEIMFYDDTLTLKRDFIVNLCEEIIKREITIKWESPTRADCIDLPLLKLMRKAGCIRLRYGVESGDEDILRLMDKNINLAKTDEVFRWTKEVGIETFAYFIIGYIHETPQTMRRTISFAKKLNPDLVMFTIATPYPNTPLFEMAKQEGLVDEAYWREFILGVRSERLGYLVPDAEEWIRNAYRSFYFRWSYILKKLLKIRSLRDINRYWDAARGILTFRMA